MDGVVFNCAGAAAAAAATLADLDTPRRNEDPLGESTNTVDDVDDFGGEDAISFSREDVICNNRRVAASSTGAGGCGVSSESSDVSSFDTVVDFLSVEFDVVVVDAVGVFNVFEAARESAESAINGNPVVGSNEIAPSAINVFFFSVLKNQFNFEIKKNFFFFFFFFSPL
jgi:hypothetical protein